MQNFFDTINVQYESGTPYYVHDVNLSIDTLLHTNDSDLEFYLIHNSTTDTVIYQAGGSGDNFINTVLNYSASGLISGGTAPFNGEFKPARPLSQFNNQDINGTWILKIYDRNTGNTGILNAWSLSFVIGLNPIGIQNISSETPTEYTLSQNYPNPFNPVTNIEFSIPKSSFIKLTIYDISGRELDVLVNQNMNAGKYKADWDASKYSSGVYFYRITAGNYTEVKKMMLVK